MSDLFQNISDIFFATSETALKPARKIPTAADGAFRQFHYALIIPNLH